MCIVRFIFGVDGLGHYWYIPDDMKIGNIDFYRAARWRK